MKGYYSRLSDPFPSWPHATIADQQRIQSTVGPLEMSKPTYAVIVASSVVTGAGMTTAMHSARSEKRL